MPYERFTAVDFALDERFRRWVTAPTAGEDDFWASFLAQHPQQQGALAEARLLVSRLKINPEPAPPERLAQVWAGIQREIAVGSAPQTTKSARGRIIRPGWATAVSLRWAAVWGGGLLLAGLAYWQYGRMQPVTYQTAYGETKQLTLPDGSAVTLNGHSRLTVARDWMGRAAREVRLDGEAFFAVAKQKTTAGQPVTFRVRAADLTVEVLGTRFNVNHRRRQTEVVLEEGRVRVQRDNAPVANAPTVMQPGDRVLYSEASRQLIKAVVDPADFVAWRNKLLIFKNKPVADILRLLADSYGVRTQLTNQDVATKRFSGSVPTDSLGVFFDKLQKLYGVSVRSENGRYVIE